MLFKNASAEAVKAFEEKLFALVPGAECSQTETRELMLCWLSAFAPDMTLREAKDYCLPRRRYKNHLWHAFSFRLTDCLAGEEALGAYGGFSGECFILSEETGTAYITENGSILTAQLLAKLGNVTVFTKDLTETFTVTGKDETGPYYKKAV